jgi:hypothetical protein
MYEIPRYVEQEATVFIVGFGRVRSISFLTVFM